MNRFLALALMAALCSCTTYQSNIENDRIFLTAPKSPKKLQIAKTHFKLESVIPIETTEEYLISYIERVIPYKDKLIIFSKDKKIAVINASSGKIETVIDRIGSGPGESKSIPDIAFNEESENILVYNDYNKLLFFDLKGTFLHEVKLKEEFIYENIICHEGNVLFFNQGEGYSCYPYGFNAYNLKNKTWKKYGQDKKVDFAIRARGQQMVKSKHMWYTAPLDFTLYLFENNQFVSPYEIEMTTTPVTENFTKTSSSNYNQFFREVRQNNMIYSINSVRETNNFIIFKSNQPGFFLIDKNSEETYWESYIEDDELGLQLSNYYPHEGDDNRIMFIVQPNEWLNRTISQSNIPQHLKDKISSMKVEESSNPILVFYKEIE